MSSTPVAWDGLRGWLHHAHPAEPVREALVFVGAQGSEDQCSRHSLACLADQLAAQGHSVLRFDLPGTGDSLGSLNTPDAWHHWVQATTSAVQALHRWVAPPAVGLLGLRLGALVAIEASRALPDLGLKACSLVLLAPVLQGRQHVRELRTLSAPGDELNVAGMAWGAHLPLSLHALDVSKTPEPPPVGRVLWGVAQNAKALATTQQAWAGQLDTHSTEYTHLADHIGDALHGHMPHALWQAVATWMALPSTANATLHDSTPPGAPAPAAKLGLTPPAALPTTLTDPGFCETGVLIPSAVPLAGIWCTPPANRVPTAVVVFCNTGRNPHTGWARAWVGMARALAADGLASLRFDLAGVGDSPPLPNPPAELIYNKVSLPQLSDAVTHAHQLLGRPVPVVVLGSCSGGYLAFHHACTDDRVTHLMLANVQRLVWDSSMSLHAAMATSTKTSREYLRLAMKPGTWVRLWRGHLNLHAITHKYRNSLADKASGWAKRWRGPSGPEQPPCPVEAVRQGFQALARRGTQVSVVFGVDDGARDEFARYFGGKGRGFTQLPGTRLRMLPDTDHVFTSAAAQAGLLREVRALCAPLMPPPAPRHPPSAATAERPRSG